MADLPFHVTGGLFAASQALFSEIVPMPLEFSVARVDRSRRRKLWELSHQFHCPLIGVCFEAEELRRLIHKSMPVPKDASDFFLHTTAAGNCKERNRLSETLHKTLEKRYQLHSRQYSALKTEAELRSAWQAACREGINLPAALWLCWTHPACSEPLEQEIHADIHMIQHQLGTHARVDQKALQSLQQENAVLLRQLKAAQAEIEKQRQKRVLQWEKARQSLAQLQASVSAKEVLIAQLRKEREALRRSSGETVLDQTLSGRLVESESQLQKLQRQFDALSEENAYLRREIRPHPDAAVPCTAADAAADVVVVEAEPDLAGKRVLCVGGRRAALHSYRNVVEQSGGRFMHHDGGLEENIHRIDGAVAAADLVICQAACISHNAYWRVKEHCKRTGKPCLFVKNSGVSSFERALSAFHLERAKSEVLS